MQRVEIRELLGKFQRTGPCITASGRASHEQALQRQHLRETGHGVIAHLDHAARLQITLQELHDLRARFIRYPRDDAVHCNVVEHGKLDRALRQFTETVFQQGEVR